MRVVMRNTDLIRLIEVILFPYKVDSLGNERLTCCIAK